MRVEKVTLEKDFTKGRNVVSLQGFYHCAAFHSTMEREGYALFCNELWCTFGAWKTLPSLAECLKLVQEGFDKKELRFCKSGEEIAQLFVFLRNARAGNIKFLEEMDWENGNN